MSTLGNRDDVITYYASTGSEIAQISLTIEDGHPRFAEDTEDRPCMEDAAGNLIHLDECPVCHGLFSWCIDGPEMGCIRYSRRLLEPCSGVR
jgi:hypothetical protein